MPVVIAVPEGSVVTVTQVHHTQTSITYSLGCFVKSDRPGIARQVSSFVPVHLHKPSVRQLSEDRWELVQRVLVRGTCDGGSFSAMWAESDGPAELRLEAEPPSLEISPGVTEHEV